jgi:TolA-binding protein
MEFKMAEFYHQTGHPGSAAFYYELVSRRYPGTSIAQKAKERLEQLQK